MTVSEPCLRCGRCAGCHAPSGDCPVPNTSCPTGTCPQRAASVPFHDSARTQDPRRDESEQQVNASSDMTEPTDPLLTSCAFCPWSILASSDDDKTRKEQAHAERWHADIRPDTSELCARILGEHPDEHDTIIEAMRADAREHGGIVDPNRVRERLLPRGLVRPQVLSAAYRVFKERGVLKEAGETVNTDVRSGNAGKPATLYKLVEIEERRTG